MPGQATVTINGKQWNVSVANTLTELTSGLSGVESLPELSGILFDLGYDQKYIEINMSQMLFPLDIIFINSTQGVVGVLENVLPGQSASLDNETYPGARCFLEINAGEAEGIEIGDSVAIEGYVQTAQFDFSSLMNVVIIMVLMLAMSKVLDAPTKSKSVLPAGAKAAKAPPQIANKEDLQKKKLALQNTGKEIARQSGVEFLRLDDGWQPRYATIRYWFKGSEGNEIVASDLKELRWKLSLRKTEILSQTKQNLPAAHLVEKWSKAKMRNSALALKDMEALGPDYDIDDCKQALKDYQGIERSDYSDQEEYQEAREEAWEAFLECLESLAGEEEEMVKTKCQPAVVPAKEKLPKDTGLNYLADSPEYLTQTIEDIGYRQKIDSSFEKAIERAKGLK